MFKFINKHLKKLSIISILILVVGVCFIGKAFANSVPVRTVTITGKNSSYEDSTPGSWEVTKEGYWSSSGEATVTFDVDTVLMTNNEATDIIFVLDISGSMSGDKLARVKSDAKELIETLLSDSSNNQAALITFSDSSTTLSGLTNNATSLLGYIDGLSANGGTNYYQALVKVDEILQDYEKEDGRELIVLFLTDGYPNRDTPNQIAEYNYLKSEYPYITINGIQYEMGSAILDPVVQISDNQYIADMETLNNVLFDASVVPVIYDTFEIVDYIDNNYFTLESVDDITVSEGTVRLITDDDGTQKITWTIDNLKSGSSANLTMKLKLKDEYIGVGGVYSTNEGEEIITEIEDTSEDVESEDTPILQSKYNVTYDGNAPSGCTVESIPSEDTHSVFETVLISQDEPSCDGYEFKGWEIVTEDVDKINDDYFTMPESDVVIRATWGELSLTKSMEGEVYSLPTLYKIVQESTLGIDSYLGIDFSQVSSYNNGQGVYTFSGTENDEYPVYYYRGDVDNNHVLFAGYCWLAVRTTSTGGVKLIYDGVPTDGNCNNTEEASQLSSTSAFNSSYSSPADVGYMYGTRYEYSRRSMSSGSAGIIYGNNVIWNEETQTYTLDNTYISSGWSSDITTLANGYHYTCFSTSDTCEGSVYYIYYFGGSSYAYYLTLSNGVDIEDAKEEMFTNTYDSTIKTAIDSWYSENIEKEDSEDEGYTDYLEDTVWCNDRSFYSGPLTSKDTGGTSSSYFGAYGRWSIASPSLDCPSVNDSFTVSEYNGNGALDYPVGLLTADEIILAGARAGSYTNNTSYYLYTGQAWWSLSPSYFISISAYGFYVYSNGYLYNGNVGYSYGVRPAVSLAPGIMVVNGDGTSTSPYEVMSEEDMYG